MHWVWNHSRSRGNTRIALLYVADQVRTSACEVRVGQRQLLEALNAGSKGTVEKAIKAAVDLDELVVAEPASGRRAALYRLPKAVGFVREAVRSAPESGAQNSASAPESGAQDGEDRPRSAPKTGAQDSRCAPVFEASALKSGAPPHPHKEPAGDDSEEADEPDDFQTCQPLIHAMTKAGITVSWSMQTDDWRAIAAIVRRAGVPAMVAFARDTKASTRKPVRYATFFLRGGWQGLPPTAGPKNGSSPRAETPHCGDPDCDPISRTRDTEHANGLRVSTPCPKCYYRKDTAA